MGKENKLEKREKENVIFVYFLAENGQINENNRRYFRL